MKFFSPSKSQIEIQPATSYVSWSHISSTSSFTSTSLLERVISEILHFPEILYCTNANFNSWTKQRHVVAWNYSLIGLNLCLHNVLLLLIPQTRAGDVGLNHVILVLPHPFCFIRYYPIISLHRCISMHLNHRFFFTSSSIEAICDVLRMRPFVSFSIFCYSSISTFSFLLNSSFEHDVFSYRKFWPEYPLRILSTSWLYYSQSHST